MAFLGDKFEIIDSQFIGNIAGGDGGAILAGREEQVAHFKMTGTLVEGNRAGGAGVGVHVNVYLEDNPADAFYIGQSLFSGNTTTSGSGGGLYWIHQTASPFAIEDTTFTGNYAREAGAGAYVLASDFLPPGQGPVRVDLVNSTFSGNGFSPDPLDPTAATLKGGGLAIETLFGDDDGGSDFIRLTNVTVTDNQANNQDNLPLRGGGGIWVSDTGLPDSTMLRNSIVSANTAVSGTSGNPVVQQNNIFGDDLNADESEYNFVGTGTVNLSGSTNILGDNDPKLDELQNNGGFQLADGSQILTHALLPESPAINEGDPGSVAGEGDVPLFDERGFGFGRIRLGRIDIGAFEVQCDPDFDDDGDVDGRDFMIWQRGVGTIEAENSDGDADFDGDVDGDDLACWQEHYGTGITLNANFNGDSVVDEDDFAVLLENFGMTTGAMLTDGDADGDGDVDDADFISWQVDYAEEIGNDDWIENALNFDPDDLANHQIIVTNPNDDNDGNYSIGDLSMREALALSALTDGADVVVFANWVPARMNSPSAAMTLAECSISHLPQPCSM